MPGRSGAVQAVQKRNGEFATEAEVLAFDAARYEDATGSNVKFWNKPRATVPPEQLALEDAIAQAVAEDGNESAWMT